MKNKECKICALSENEFKDCIFADCPNGMNKERFTKKETRGGFRPGSGRKHKLYGEPTTTIAFRVPQSKVTEVKELVNGKLSEWKK